MHSAGLRTVHYDQKGLGTLFIDRQKERVISTQHLYAYRYCVSLARSLHMSCWVRQNNNLPSAQSHSALASSTKLKLL